MYNRLPDLFRQLSVQSLFSTPTFQSCWPVWKNQINEILGEEFDESDIIDLGDNLTDIFRTTGEEGRGQGSLSGGGVAWESLVCWYINLCLIGSRTVSFRRMSLVPQPIQDAITVNYGNFACNTESDITVVVFPDINDYNIPLTEITLNQNGELVPPVQRDSINLELANLLCTRDFRFYEIGVIQFKTNWNDNAQIPMLWDMIYSANGFRGRNITIGRQGFNIHDASNFTYSFVTVPSNQRANYNGNSVAVRRITSLSGGNYWGKPTQQNIARSLKEIFLNNYQSGFRENIRVDISNGLAELNNQLSYFDII